MAETCGVHVNDYGTNIDVTVQEAEVALDISAAIEGGRWAIVGTQMILYDVNNVTEVARFNLKDSLGNPAKQTVFE